MELPSLSDPLFGLFNRFLAHLSVVLEELLEHILFHLRLEVFLDQPQLVVRDALLLLSIGIASFGRETSRVPFRGVLATSRLLDVLLNKLLGNESRLALGQVLDPRNVFQGDFISCKLA